MKREANTYAEEAMILGIRLDNDFDDLMERYYFHAKKIDKFGRIDVPMVDGECVKSFVRVMDKDLGVIVGGVMTENQGIVQFRKLSLSEKFKVLQFMASCVEDGVVKKRWGMP